MYPKKIMKNYRWFIYGTMIFMPILNGCKPEKTSSGCLLNVLKKGAKIAEIKDENVHFTISKEWLKADVFSLVKQMEKISNQYSDTLILNRIEVVKDGDEYIMLAEGLRGNDKAITMGIYLERNKNDLLISAKPIEGCLGSHCSKCKLNKGKGCSCEQTGNCDHIVLEVPFLL